MGRKLIGRSSTRLLVPLAMIALTGLGVSVASDYPGRVTPDTRIQCFIPGSGV
jgi:hypothetical protein